MKINLKEKKIINFAKCSDKNLNTNNKCFFKKYILKIFIFFVIILTIVEMSGLYDVKRIERSAYIIAMGLDKGPNDTILLTLQMVPPNILNMQSSSSSGGELYTTTVAANSIEEGVALAHSYISTILNFSHSRALVVSEDMAKSGIYKYFLSLSNSTSYNTNMNVYISKCSAQTFLENVKPSLEVNPVQYYDILKHSISTSGTTVATTLIEFVKKMYSDTAFPVATLCNIKDTKDEEKTDNKTTSSEDNANINKEKEDSNTGSEKDSLNKESSDKESTKTTNDNTKNIKPQNSSDYLAGEIPRKSDYKTEIFGAALFKEGKFIGELTGKEVNYYLMIKGELNNMYTDIILGNEILNSTTPEINAPNSNEVDPNIDIIRDEQGSNKTSNYGDVDTVKSSKNNNSIYHVYLKQQRKPQINVEIKNDIPVVKINIFLNTTVLGTENYSYNYTNLTNMNLAVSCLKQSLLTNINKYLDKITKTYKVDINDFGKYAKKYFLTIKELDEYNWLKKYDKTSFDVSFTIYPTNPGLSKQK